MANSNEIEQKPVSVDDWHRLIASKSKCKVDDVKTTLDKYGVFPQATIPIRKAIHFEVLKFSGVKAGTEDDRGFSFEWSGLEEGLYGVLSEDNLVGKSSILRLLYGALRGDFSSVSQVVMGWINNFYAKFSVGDVSFELELTKYDGEFKASLTRAQATIRIQEYVGPLSGLSSVVDQLMMKELEFDRMFATKESKSLVPHGWPALASALFVSGSEGAIIGDLQMSGLPQKLLQLFIGLPWISTQSRASAVLKIEEQSKKNNQKKSDDDSVVSNAVSRLKKQLIELPDTKELEDVRKNDRARQLQLGSQIDQNITESRDINIALGRIETEKSILVAECLKMKRLKQSIEDDKSAGFIFRKLRPVCCPSCESTVFKLDGSSCGENHPSKCPLCKEDEVSNELENDTTILEINDDIVIIKGKISVHSNTYDSYSKKLIEINKKMESDKKELSDVSKKLSSSSLCGHPSVNNRTV